MKLPQLTVSGLHGAPGFKQSLQALHWVYMSLVTIHRSFPEKQGSTVCHSAFAPFLCGGGWTPPLGWTEYLWKRLPRGHGGWRMAGGPSKGTGVPRNLVASATPTPGSAARPRGVTAAKPTSCYDLPLYFHREENFSLYKSLWWLWWQPAKEVSALVCAGQQLLGFWRGWGQVLRGGGGAAAELLL